MLRMVVYDIMSITAVIIHIMTFVIICKDSKKRGALCTVVWCIINFCLPIVGFISYCIYSKCISKKTNQ